MKDILFFIKTLRESDEYIKDIYMNGGCYQFHLILKAFFPNCYPFINKHKNHVVTEHEGFFYDITGEVFGGSYRPITKYEINKASKWSFAKHNLLKITECPACEEPITVKLNNQ